MLTLSEIRLSIDTAIPRWAPQLHVASSGINAVAALKALACNESDYGARWSASRHEPAYCYGGRYYRNDANLRNLSIVWGCSAHESWGVWQIMYVTAFELGYRDDPVRLRVPEVSIEYVVRLVNKRTLDRIMDCTPEDVADAYNTGQARDGIDNPKYVADFMEHYRRLTA